MKITSLVAEPLRVVAIAVILFSPFNVRAADDDPTDLPRVEAVKPFIPFCRGSTCEGLLLSLGMIEWSPTDQELFREGGGDRLTKEQFCAEMKAHPPEDCDVDNPPSSPGFDPGWTSNGCGDGSFKSAFAAAVGRLVLPDFGGELDNPLPGISFLGACAFHDRCYTTKISKASCDKSFFSQMELSCGSGSNTYGDQCQDIAAAYFGVVGVEGDDAYAQAQQERECAAWAEDMEANKCE